ncbi:MAG: PAS domain-containing protein [Aquisalimonadaceae bacterium]
MTSNELLEAERRRLDAENRIKSGTAPPADTWTVNADALGVLYRLASSSDSAPDALKLLHELQVHQVELGLQRGQMESAAQEMTESLTRYQAFYELAPLAYLVVDRAGVIIEANRAGINLLGVSRDAVTGRNLAEFVAAESRSALANLFTALRDESHDATCDIRFNRNNIPSRIVASVPTDGDIALMIVVERQGSREP